MIAPFRVRTLAAALLLAACGGGADARPAGIRAEGAWARPVAVGPAPDTTAHGAHGHDAHAEHGAASNGVVYLTLRNDGAEPELLMGVETDVANATELHRTRLEDGIARMRPAGEVEIPAAATVELRPGDLHVMLVGVRRALAPGDRFPLRLRFRHAGVREVEVEVRAP